MQRREQGCWRSVWALLIALAAVSPEHAAANGDLIIAVPAATAGPHAETGRSLTVAAQMTVDVLNAGGGIGGRRLVVTPVVDSCTSQTGAAAFEAVAAGPAAVVIGHACTPTAALAAPLYQRAGKLFIAVDQSPRARPRPGPLSFHVAQTEGSQGAMIAAALLAAQAKRVAIVSDRTAFATGLAKEAHTALAAGGTMPVLVDTFIAGTLDFDPLAARIVAAGATHAVIAGFPAEGGPLAAALVSAKPDIVLLASDSLATREFVDLARRAIDAVHVPLRPAAESWAARTPAATRFAEAMKAQGAAPTTAAFQVAAAIEAFAEAARTRPDGTWPTADEIAARLAKEAPATLLGPLSFDARGAARIPARQWHRWRDGAWQPIESVQQ